MRDLAPLLNPQSIAVIGASPDTKILRGRTLKLLLSRSYSGRVYPISRSHAEIQGLKAYASVDVLPETIDLAILIIPAEHVVDELERCGKNRIKAALIITSGFAEQLGEAGANMQRRVREIAERYGMIVCGPNTEGFVNSKADLCATFSPVVDGLSVPLIPTHRSRGHIAVIAQSGGMGFAFFDRGRPRELPFNYIVTTGNEACLEAFDVIEHLLDDGSTDVFMVFLENIKNADTFKRVAEKALRAGTPIIVTKIGHSDAGQRAAASHTAALAGSYAAYQALFRHYGIIEADDIDQMVDFAAAFSYYKDNFPRGVRVGIGTASGGGGGWMADACIAAGLEVPPLDVATRALIDKHLPPYGTSQNPVDGTAQAIREIGYAELARLIALSPEVDAVVMVTSARNPELFERDKEQLASIAQTCPKPVFMWTYTLPHEHATKILSECGLPLFTQMSHCATAISALAQYRAVRDAYETASQEPINSERVQRWRSRLINTALCEYELTPLLNDYGIATIESRLAKSRDDAVIAARSMGAVALKVQSREILHKSDANALALDVTGDAVVQEHFDRILRNARTAKPNANIDGVLVQRMAQPGIEMLVSLRYEEPFGPMLTLGLGGIHVEVLRDVAITPLPLTRLQARKLIASLRGAELLRGMRGQPAADVEALIELMMRLSALAIELRDAMSELELNPVIVHSQGHGVSVVDGLFIGRESSLAH